MNSANTYNAPSLEMNVMQPTVKPASRILSAGAVRVSPDRIAVGPVAEEVCATNPRIQTRQRDGAISEIVITCGCGQQTVIQCDYSDARTKS